MPKLGFMLNAPGKYPWWDAFQADLAELARLGYHGVELSVGDPAEIDIARLEKALAGHGLALAAIATGASYFGEGLCLTSPDALVRRRAIQRLQAHVDLAAQFGSVIVIGQMQGFKSDEPDREKANQRTVECLRQVAGYAAPRHVQLVLEPVNRFEVGHNYTAVEVLELVERIGSPALTIMLDTFHINIEETSLDGPVYLVGNRLGHLHAFDNHRGLVGTGHLDLGLILRATLKVGYQGYWVFGDFSANSLPVRAAAVIEFLQRAELSAGSRESGARSQESGDRLPTPDSRLPIPYSVVITDYAYDTFEAERSALSPLGITLACCNCRTEDDVIQQAADADALIVVAAPITGRVLDALPHCRLVTRYGIGVDVVDVPAATQRGVLVTNVPDYCQEEVADHAMALLLACARKTALLDRAIRDGRAVKESSWNTIGLVRPVHRLSRQTLGIIGLGRIGRQVARRAQAFGMRVLAAHDPAVSPEQAAAWSVTVLPLEQMLSEVDYLTLHVPLLESTRQIINADRLALMKPGAVIINTSRGALIDQAALIEALSHGRLAGAGLDVYEREPILPDHPLCQMDNVVLASHAAWYSEGALSDLKAKALQAAVDLFQGRVPKYVVNPTVLELPGARWRGQKVV